VKSENITHSVDLCNLLTFPGLLWVSCVTGLWTCCRSLVGGPGGRRVPGEMAEAEESNYTSGKKNPFSLVYLGTRRKPVEQHNFVA